VCDGRPQLALSKGDAIEERKSKKLRLRGVETSAAGESSG